MANAACALGHSLGLLQTCEIALSSMSELKRPYEFIENDLNRPLLQERLGTEDLLLLQELFVKWSHVLRELVDAQFLVHGDFNHRNAVLDRKNGRWEVMGILDWELACVGSPLWDAARFICYEKADSLHWEPHFLEGFNAQGIGLPEEWDSLSCVINTISAAQGLASSRVQERFIPELRGLVHSGLRGKRIRLK
jgi:Ser/Thr protein kinase RdoA (MazF antagonist)